MSRIFVVAALAVPAIIVAAAPLAACNPDDCGKGRLSAEELRLDREMTRELNREELRYTTRRDAEYARQRQRTQQRLRADYERQRADYKRRMAEWREAVRRCEAGDVRYCDG